MNHNLWVLGPLSLRDRSSHVHRLTARRTRNVKHSSILIDIGGFAELVELNEKSPQILHP